MRGVASCWRRGGSPWRVRPLLLPHPGFSLSPLVLKFGGEPLAKRRPCASQLVAETVRTGRRSPGASKVQARPGSAQRRCDRRVPQVALPQASRL